MTNITIGIDGMDGIDGLDGLVGVQGGSNGLDGIKVIGLDGSNGLDGVSNGSNGLGLTRPGNRGNKLRTKQSISNLTSRPTLNPIIQFHDDLELIHVGKRRAIRRKSNLLELDQDQDDPYAGINIEGFHPY